jgi:MYXO-CTERM domain-containing protein
MQFPSLRRFPLTSVLVAVSLYAVLSPRPAGAVSSAELYTSKAYTYGRIEARIQYAAGDGVVSSFFMWKDGSEKADVFWNELDFEKLEGECRLQTNALYGLPESSNEGKHELALDLCGAFHTYTYEWTPEYIAWFVDDVEIRRDSGPTAQAFAENAAAGMQIRFNVWPGDSSFGGNFDPATLPVHQYINWVQYSSYQAGAFQFEWREDFTATTRPSGWSTGSWDSPKGLSTHSAANVTFVNGFAVVSLTADDATGSAGVMPSDPTDPSPVPTAPTPSATPTTPPAGSAGAPSLPVAPAPEAEPTSDEGCTCRTTGHGAHGAVPWATWSFAVAALAWLRRRRE